MPKMDTDQLLKDVDIKKQFETTLAQQLMKSTKDNMMIN